MNRESFTGHSSQMKPPSDWLASEDIAHLGDIKLTVEEVFDNKQVEFEAGRKEDKFSIKYVNGQKEMIVNSGHRKQMTLFFGPETKDWRGKTITLYVDTNVRLAGKTVSGIRIRPTLPAQQKKKPKPAETSSVAEILLGRLDNVTDATQMPAISEAIEEVECTADELKALQDRYEAVEAKLKGK